MNKEDGEWLLEWINSCKDEKFKEMNEEWDIEKIEDHYDKAETSLFKAGVNHGIEKAFDLYTRKFYEYQGREIEKVEKELEEIEEELEEIDDEEEVERKKKKIKETRQIIDQMKKKRENFLKPMIEGNIEEAAQYNG